MEKVTKETVREDFTAWIKVAPHETFKKVKDFEDYIGVFFDEAYDRIYKRAVEDAVGELKQISHDLSEDSFDRIISQFEALSAL